MSEVDPLLAEQLSVDISNHYGVTTYPTPNGHVIMSRRDWRDYEPAVWADRTIDAVGRGYYLGAAQIDVQPDWMFDPLDIALARLIAVLIRGLRLCLLVDRLARILTPKENKHG